MEDEIQNADDIIPCTDCGYMMDVTKDICPICGLPKLYGKDYNLKLKKIGDEYNDTKNE